MDSGAPSPPKLLQWKHDREESKTGLEDWKGKRYMYGVSNGGAFCMYAGINYPDLFEEVIAFSTADYISEMIQPIKSVGLYSCFS